MTLIRLWWSIIKWMSAVRCCKHSETFWWYLSGQLTHYWRNQSMTNRYRKRSPNRWGNIVPGGSLKMADKVTLIEPGYNLKMAEQGDIDWAWIQPGDGCTRWHWLSLGNKVTLIEEGYNQMVAQGNIDWTWIQPGDGCTWWHWAWIQPGDGLTWWHWAWIQPGNGWTWWHWAWIQPEDGWTR